MVVATAVPAAAAAVPASAAGAVTAAAAAAGMRMLSMLDGCDIDGQV